MKQMKSKFKIQIRKNCLVCHGPLPTKRHRTFCSDRCRDDNTNRKHREDLVFRENNRLRQKEERDLIASEPSPDKCQCLICGKWYVQVGSHIFLTHHMTAREYREEMDLEVKRGTVPEWYRRMKGQTAKDNGTFKNLIVGQKFWFEKGQKGVGIYKRSPITLERLSKLHTFNKTYKKKGR